MSVEHAAREPTPDLPLEPEDENGENMPDELPEEELPHHVSHAALRFRMRLQSLLAGFAERGMTRRIALFCSSLCMTAFFRAWRL